MAFYFVSTFAIAQTPTKQPALRLSRTKNLHLINALNGLDAIKLNQLRAFLYSLLKFRGSKKAKLTQQPLKILET
jgi:hypothetical protein